MPPRARRSAQATDGTSAPPLRGEATASACRDTAAVQRITLWGDGHRYAFFVCPTCGALVADVSLHDAWHRTHGDAGHDEDDAGEKRPA
jgi:hypothetical protein